MYVRMYVCMYVCMVQTSTAGVLLLKPLLVDFVDWGSRKTPQLDCGWGRFYATVHLNSLGQGSSEGGGAEGLTLATFLGWLVCFGVGGFIRFAVDWIEGVGFSCCAT